MTSDIALHEGFVSLYTREAGAVATSPAGTAPVAEPFTIAEERVARGEMRPAGTTRRDGRTLEAFTGPARPFLVGEGEGTIAPAGATVRFLRDQGTDRPVELRIPAVRLAADGVGSAAVPAQRYVVTGFREYPATEESMTVFDISAVYDGAGAATTATTP
ncbi:MAG TPA: hypothetical protein PKD59_18225 [Miltoncostaeaceae bacterium]|nr:hypothetical protein [Miltoncostaeaceae bacterium]